MPWGRGDSVSREHAAGANVFGQKLDQLALPLRILEGQGGGQSQIEPFGAAFTKVGRSLHVRAHCLWYGRVTIPVACLAIAGKTYFISQYGAWANSSPA